jgi:TrmH family RNA methyltransferase
MSGKLTKNHAKYIKSLQQKKFREEYGVFVIEGEKLLSEALETGQSVESIVVTSEWLDSYSGSLPDHILCSKREMSSISSLKNPPGCLLVLKQNPTSDRPNFEENIVVIESLKDPGNLGTILRTCDWFGISQVGFIGESVDPFNPKVVQSSMGSILRVKLFQLPYSDLKLLSDAPTSAFRADLEGQSIYEFTPAEPFALFLGSESHGFSQEVKSAIKQAVTIPKFGEAESLNVGVSAAIILSEFKRKLYSSRQ